MSRPVVRRNLRVARFFLIYLCAILGVQGADSDFTDGASGSTARLSVAASTGPQTVFVALLYFSDDPATFTRDEYVNVTNQICSYFAQSSYGKTSLIPTVTSRFYLMPHPSTYYRRSGSNFWGLERDAYSVVFPDYGNIYNYGHIVYAFPKLPAICGWAQSAFTITWNYGVTPVGETYSNGNNGLWLGVHEMGHSYGLGHAHKWEPCDLSNPVDPCGYIIRYGDCFDMMAQHGPTHDFSPYEKVLLGWIPPEKIVNVVSSGVYRVYRFDNDANAINYPTLALSFPSPGTGQTYYVGYRYAQPETQNGAYIIWGDNCSPKLIDHYPPTSCGSDAIFPVGTTLVDGGLQITPLTIGGTAPDTWIDVQVIVP